MDWLQDLAEWLFDGPPTPRLELLLAHLDAMSDERAAVTRCCAGVFAELDYVRLFTDTGVPSEAAFLPELAKRTLLNLLPAPPIEREAAHGAPSPVPTAEGSPQRPSSPSLAPAHAVLFRLFRRPARGRWLFELEPELRALLFERVGAPAGPTLEPIRRSMRDAVVLLAIRAAAAGTADDVRERTGRSLGLSPFLHLPELVTGVVNGGTLTATQAEIAACRVVLDRVVASLEATGISLALVYRLEYLRHLLDRLETLLPLLTPRRDADADALALLYTLIQGGWRDRSVLDLIRTNGHLLARRVTERAGHTGEHYVTRTSAELDAMVTSAAGGGAWTAVAVALKALISIAALPLLLEAGAIALTYAGIFTLLQLCHFTLATKQPAMTAAALAHTMKHTGNTTDLAPIVDQVIRTIRSQLAAFFGNLGMVVPVAIGLDLAWKAMVGHHLLDAEHADAYVAAHHPFDSGTLLFAALTGVYLWLGSVVGGMAENWFVVQRLPDAIRTNRLLHATLGRARAARLGVWATENVAGFGQNVALGLLLALVPMVTGMLGVQLEVRHVTFVTGLLTFAGMSHGPLVVLEPGFLWALAGVLGVGALNFLVSFTLALFVAFRARDVRRYDQFGLLVAVVKHAVRHPFDLVRAPATG